MSPRCPLLGKISLIGYSATQTNPWLISLGYSLCYGIIIIKMIRVWVLFNRPFGFKTVSVYNMSTMVNYLTLLLIVPIQGLSDGDVCPVSGHH